MRRFLAILLVVYVAKEIVMALVVPPFTGHDELAHYAQLRILATQGRLATLWDRIPVSLSAYRDYTLDWSPQGAPVYTAVHPPGYYAVVLPLYKMSAAATPEAQQFL